MAGDLATTAVLSCLRTNKVGTSCRSVIRIRLIGHTAYFDERCARVLLLLHRRQGRRLWCGCNACGGCAWLPP